MFTDKNFKQLKEDIYLQTDDSTECLRIVTLKSILARLAEAEKLLPPEALEDCGIKECEDCKVYRPWRKTAGR